MNTDRKATLKRRELLSALVFLPGLAAGSPEVDRCFSEACTLGRVKAAWLPEVMGSGSDPEVIYNLQVGDHSVTGNCVTFQAHLVIKAISGGSGAILVGLPRAARLGMTQICSIHHTQYSYPKVANLLIPSGMAHGVIDVTGYAPASIGDIAAGDSIIYGGSYFI